MNINEAEVIMTNIMTEETGSADHPFESSILPHNSRYTSPSYPCVMAGMLCTSM